MRKIGPLSIDIVIACQVYEYQGEGDKGVGFQRLVDGLQGIAAKSTILNSLNTLAQWGVVKVEFGETKAGRAGRLYSVSGESKDMVKETYEIFWDRVLEAMEETRRDSPEAD